MLRRSNAEPKKENSDRWLLTYSDLITLLMIFFIIMYSMSKIDSKKFEEIATSLNGALGSGQKSVIDGSPGSSMINGKLPEIKDTPEPNNNKGNKSEMDKMNDIKNKLEELAKQKGLSPHIKVRISEAGVNIVITDQVLFNSGYADLTPQSQDLIEKIGFILSGIPDHYIRIEGHTDNIPISNSQFKSNWDLAAQRAITVSMVLIHNGALKSNLISAVSFGEFRPIASNSTKEGRDKNRRVEIVILKTMYNATENKQE